MRNKNTKNIVHFRQSCDNLKAKHFIYFEIEEMQKYVPN